MEERKGSSRFCSHVQASVLQRYFSIQSVCGKTAERNKTTTVTTTKQDQPEQVPTSVQESQTGQKTDESPNIKKSTKYTEKFQSRKIGFTYFIVGDYYQ